MRFVLVAVLIAVAGAGEPASDLEIRRLAMEAHIKLGDALLEKGDVDGAIKAYNEAIRLYRGPATKRKAAPKPFTGPKADEVIAIPGRPLKGALKPSGVAMREPVAAALAWLAAHQDVDSDGKWDADGFDKHDPAGDKSGGHGGALFDVGVTGLSLLAFLGAGYTDRGSKRDNPYAKNVRMGLRYLMTQQDTEGLFGSRRSQHFIYNHAVATLAMCEAYWMTRNPRYKKPAQDALNYIARARNPYLGWRYSPRGGDNDTSVTALCVMALKSGQFGGLDIDPDAWEGARQWIDKMTDRQTGQVGYIQPGGVSARTQGRQNAFPAKNSHAMTAAGILTRIFTGEDPDGHELIQRGTQLCLSKPPLWSTEAKSIDMYYWFVGTLAMFQVSADAWRVWSANLDAAIVKTQHAKGSGAKAGSWDPAGPWGPEGGRIYSTALMTMCLEVYFRYDRVFGTRTKPK